MCPLALRYFGLLKRVLKDFNETTGNIKQNIVNILSKYNSRLFSSAFLTGSAKQILFSVNFLLMKIKRFLSSKYLHTLYTTLLKGICFAYV